MSWDCESFASKAGFYAEKRAVRCAMVGFINVSNVLMILPTDTHS